jgi:hypothetical protein
MISRLAGDGGGKRRAGAAPVLRRSNQLGARKNTTYNPSGLGGNSPSCQNAARQNTLRTIATIARGVCQSPNCIEILLKYSQVAAAAVSDLAYVALGFTADGLITEKKKYGCATTVI